MTNEEISLNTKKALAKALKIRVNYAPFDKIKVSHLIKDCNITHSTFYYHFTDIYDLLEWIFEFEAVIPLKELENINNFDDTLILFMNYLRDNDKLFISAYKSLGREIMEKSIFNQLKLIVEKKAKLVQFLIKNFWIILILLKDSNILK